VQLCECLHIRGNLLNLPIHLDVLHCPVFLTEQLWLQFSQGEVSRLKLLLLFFILQSLTLFKVRLIVGYILIANEIQVPWISLQGLWREEGSTQFCSTID
jgi:hypothetical protein